MLCKHKYVANREGKQVTKEFECRVQDAVAARVAVSFEAAPPKALPKAANYRQSARTERQSASFRHLASVELATPGKPVSSDTSIIFVAPT